MVLKHTRVVDDLLPLETGTIALNRALLSNQPSIEIAHVVVDSRLRYAFLWSPSSCHKILFHIFRCTTVTSV